MSFCDCEIKFFNNGISFMNRLALKFKIPGLFTYYFLYRSLTNASNNEEYDSENKNQFIPFVEPEIALAPWEPKE